MTAFSFDPDLVRRAMETAVELARTAGALQRESVTSVTSIENKGVVDLVTEVDITSEKLIAEGLQAEFPAFRLVGEEGTTGADESAYGWYIDPIDGTTNFAHGYPQWAVSICLEFEGEPIAGVVYDPSRDEMFTAMTGQGAFLNGALIHVTTTDDLMRAMVATGFSYDINARGEQFALWEAFNNQTQAARRDGAAALNMAWVACGRIDAYAERWVNSWDVGAGVVIAREAGGTVSAMDGGPYVLTDREVCCSNGCLHDAFVQLITTTIDW